MISHAAYTTPTPAREQLDLPSFGRVLVPLDGSLLAEEALPTAIAFAQRAGPNGKVILLRVSRAEFIVSTRGGPVAVPTKADQEIDAYLDRLETALRTQGIRVETAHTTGDAAVGISDIGHDQHADLIVMVTHAREGVSRLVHGSLAERVLQRTSLPILLLKHGEQPIDMFSPTRRPHLLVPLDGSALAESALPWAISLARQLSATITLICSLDLPDLTLSDRGRAGAANDAIRVDVPTERQEARQYLAQMQQRLESYGIPVTIALGEGGAADDIATQAKALEAIGDTTIIVMSTHGRTGLRRRLYGSVADAVLHLADVPLLVIRTH